MWAAWRGPLVSHAIRVPNLYTSTHAFHTSAPSPKKSASKYTKLVLLHARSKRNNERAAKKAAATRAKGKEEKEEKPKKVGKGEEDKPEPQPKVAPPPPKVVSFPRPSSKRAPRPTSFLRGKEADAARLVRLEEFKDGQGTSGERAGRLAAADIAVQSTSPY